jgi:hypothetical protein
LSLGLGCEKTGIVGVGSVVRVCNRRSQRSRSGIQEEGRENMGDGINWVGRSRAIHTGLREGYREAH